MKVRDRANLIKRHLFAAKDICSGTSGRNQAGPTKNSGAERKLEERNWVPRGHGDRIDGVTE